MPRQRRTCARYVSPLDLALLFLSFSLFLSLAPALRTRYKFSDIRPFVSFEMGQFSPYLMVIAFLVRHIAFHSVQCVRPIYQPPPRALFLALNFFYATVRPSEKRACIRQLLPWLCAPFFRYSPPPPPPHTKPLFLWAANDLVVAEGTVRFNSSPDDHNFRTSSTLSLH